MTRTDPLLRTTGRRQSGSAYILTLLALLVISVLGLSLVFITQTEMEIGSNERTIQRVFYAAESGLAISTARILVSQDYLPMEVNLEPGSALIHSRTSIAGARPVYTAPCNLCEINNPGDYSNKEYVTLNVALQATGQRVTGSRTLGSRTLSSMVLFTPIEAPPEPFDQVDGNYGGLIPP